MPMKRTGLNLPEKQLAQLKALSAKTGAPVSELVRRAIEAFLKKSKRAK
jgi:Predicted transcriptional regulators containing the CopG/Arc/MetJ DNA-binding domain and a metal-binding domain